VKRYLVLGGIATAFVVMAVLGVRLAIEQRVNAALVRANFVRAAKEGGGILGRRVSERQAIKEIQSPDNRSFVEAVKKADKKSRVESVGTTTARITDQPAGTVVQTPAGPSEWHDEHHRFRLVLPSGPFFRQQAFWVEQVAVRGSDGQTVVQRTDFAELDPVTGERLPSAGITLDSKLSVVDQPKPDPPVVKLRGLLGVDHRGAVALGLEFANLERTHLPFFENLSAAVEGYYDPQDSGKRLAFKPGYRLLKTNIVIGPYVGIELGGKGSGLVFGGSAVVRVN
jgi:hypothetical protein